jgi:hypothetical protein
MLLAAAGRRGYHCCLAGIIIQLCVARTCALYIVLKLSFVKVTAKEVSVLAGCHAISLHPTTLMLAVALNEKIYSQ